MKHSVLWMVILGTGLSRAGLMTDAEFEETVFSNVGRISSNAQVAGIVVEHGGAGDWSVAEPDAPNVIRLTPRKMATCWTDDATVELCDRAVDYLIARCNLPKDVKIVSRGFGAGGTGAIVWARYTRHPLAGVFAVSGIFDLAKFSASEGSGIAEAFKSAEVVACHSPVRLVKELPNVPYFIFQTKGDEIVKTAEQSDPFVQAMKAAGKDVTYDLADGGGFCRMTEFQRRRYHRACAAALRGQREPLVLTFTFDDATADHMIAATVLEKFGWRGSFNIVTAWVDRETANPQSYDGNRALTWSQCRELALRGHRVNTHSAHHISFTKLAAEGKIEESRQEILGSRDAISKSVGRPPKFFTWPCNQQSKEASEIALKAGMPPMLSEGVRTGFGGACPQIPSVLPNDPDGTNSLAAVITRFYEKGYAFQDLMFHGIDPKIGVWRPYAHKDDFEKSLPEVKAMEKSGKVVIVDYDEFYDFAASRAYQPRRKR